MPALATYALGIRMSTSFIYISVKNPLAHERGMEIGRQPFPAPVWWDGRFCDASSVALGAFSL